MEVFPPFSEVNWSIYYVYKSSVKHSFTIRNMGQTARVEPVPYVAKNRVFSGVYHPSTHPLHSSVGKRPNSSSENSHSNSFR